MAEKKKKKKSWSERARESLSGAYKMPEEFKELNRRRKQLRDAFK